MHLKRRSSITVSKRQSGSALVTATFVIVVLGLLVSVLARLVSTSSESVVVEVLGNRSFLAAETGLQNAMTELFPVGSGIQSCDEVNQSKVGLSSGGLKRCNYKVECSDYLYSDKNETHYRLESTGQCTGGEQVASRQLVIESRSIQ
jgi:MSHA biogenesis protein MshP